RLARDVGALPIDRQRRAGLLRIRLGVDAAGGGLLRRVPRARPSPGAVDPDPRAALDAVPHGGRRRSHQAARRSVLARSDVPLLPPRNAADAEPPERAVPPSPAIHAAGGRRVQPLRPTGGSLRVVPSPT